MPIDAAATLHALPGDPLAWLLDGEEPAVRHVALRDLVGLAPGDPALVTARTRAMREGPIPAILAAQDPAGWWARAGSGYQPKYTGTVWQVLFLDQLGADPADERVRAGAAYALEHAATSAGGLGMRMDAREAPPAPSSAIHCLNGNLLRALVGLGWLDDERVRAAAAWQAAVITGEGDAPFYRSSVPGPGFRCGANDGLPCAWGAVRALGGLTRIPAAHRSPAVTAAIEAGVAFLLGRDPSMADYPVGYGGGRPSGSWFRLGFPGGYVCDVLAVLEALAEAGAIADPRLANALAWLMAQQVAPGRWPNRYAYAGKLVADIDRPNAPSRWVTLRACRVLAAAAAAGVAPA